MAQEFIQSSWKRQDKALETKLRPSQLSDFLGQDSILEKLQVFIGAAKQRKETLGHTLFYGPPGLGKTTLASIISQEMDTNLVMTSGPSIEKPGDLAGILTSLNEGDVLFIDEIHRLNRAIEEYLYSAMEDYKLDLMLDSGPAARSVQVKLNPFTLVGATTRFGLLSGPLRSRFGFTCRLDYYPSEVLAKIIARSASILNVTMNHEAFEEIARRSRGTPRIANNLLRWVRDYAQMRNNNQLDRITTRTALEMLNIDHRGLDEMDKRLLSTIIDHHKGGPVGIGAVAAALNEDSTTLSEVNEPYLLMLGFLRRTQRGREVTELGYKHLGRKAPVNENQGDETCV